LPSKPYKPRVNALLSAEYSSGAIPPLAELQAQLWVYRWLQNFHGNKLVRRNLGTLDLANGKMAPLLDEEADEGFIAPYELDYALHARGSYDFFSTKRGVDHESYAYQLALDMGAAPTFWHMVRKHSWRVLWTWAMGPNFNTKFRLVGPWANPNVAVPIMEGELFGVVKRTGGAFCE
jgi:dimethylaniline monooxygenase (N-oxide forming)